MNRFFVPPENFHEGQVVIRGDDVKHISTVLRMKAGDKIHVLDGRGCLYDVQLAEIKRKEIVGHILSKQKYQTESPLKIRMGQALIKGNKFDHVVRKAVELGVRSIACLRTERCIARLKKEDEESRINRWQKIAREASKQCGRSEAPVIDNAVRSLGQFCEGSRDCDLKFIFWENEKTARLKELKAPSKISSIAFLAGPEGGFLPSEVELAKKYGFRPVTLGPRILTADSASLVILSILQSLWGDL